RRRAHLRRAGRLEAPTVVGGYRYLLPRPRQAAGGAAAPVGPDRRPARRGRGRGRVVVARPARLLARRLHGRAGGYAGEAARLPAVGGAATGPGLPLAALRAVAGPGHGDGARPGLRPAQGQRDRGIGLGAAGAGAAAPGGRGGGGSLLLLVLAS